MTAAPPLIAFAHVGKSFDGGRGATPVVRERRSRSTSRGECSPSRGSGSGKTTLLRLANRLIEAIAAASRSTAGCAQDRSDSAAPPHRLRVQSGGLFPHMKRRRQYRHHAKTARLSAAEIASRVDNRSTWCGLIVPAPRSLAA